MKKQFKLNIEKPCGEKVNQFKPTQNGGFCGSCEKEVIDFTKMKSADIIEYFQTKNTTKTCGIFKKKQLKSYAVSQKRNRFSFSSGVGLALISLFSFGKIQAQETDKQMKPKTGAISQNIEEANIEVKGIVAEDGQPLPGVNIVLEGSLRGTSTDFDGNFKFPGKLKKGDVLLFSFVGMESKKVVITKDTSKLDVSLKVNLKMDTCVIVGEVIAKKVYRSK